MNLILFFRCIFLIAACRTTELSRDDCKFPFVYNNKTYNSCSYETISNETDPYPYWCATKINDKTREMEKWGNCDIHCTRMNKYACTILPNQVSISFFRNVNFLSNTILFF